MRLRRGGAVRCCAIAAAVLAVGLWIAWGRPAAASVHPVSVTFQYTCTTPDIPFVSQPMTAELEWGFDTPVTVGAPSQSRGITVLLSLTSTELSAFKVVGATSIEGTGKVPVEVRAPQGEISLTVPLRVPRTAIPPSGTAEFEATGTPPVQTFHQPGDGYITVGSSTTMQITPLNASGADTGAGTVNATCTLNDGQNTDLGSFVIVRPDSSAAPTSPDPTVSNASSSWTAPRTVSPARSASKPIVVPTVPTTAPAPAVLTQGSGGGGTSLFGIPVATLVILLGMVTAIVCAIAFIAFVAFKAGRLTQRRP